MEVNNRRISQPARKAVARIAKDGIEVDRWDSIRQMCDALQYDRRAVIRVLNKTPGFRSVHGYRFKYIDDETTA